MNLSFEHLTISNFGSFSKEQKLILAPSAGLYFIKAKNLDEPALGSNGGGKSTLWNALCWCLFGKTVNGGRNPDIEPWTGPKETRVTLELRIDDVQFVVTRSTHPNRLLIDGAEAGQDKVINLIGLDFNTFIHTILWGQGEPLFFDLDPRKQMELLSDVLLLDRWDARSNAAKERAATLGLKQSTINGQLESAKASHQQVVGFLKDAKAKSDAWDKEEATRIEVRNTAIKSLEKTLEGLFNQRGKADQAYDSAMTELKDLNNGIIQLNDYLTISLREKNKHELRIEANKRLIDTITKQIAAPPGKCPACGQTIKAADAEKHREENRLQLTALKKDLKVPNAVLSQITDLEKQLADAKAHAQQFTDKAEKAKDELYHIQPEYTKAKLMLDGLKEAQAKDDKHENPYFDQLDLMRRGAKKSRLKIEALEKDLKLTARREARAKFWVKGFKEIRLTIAEEFVEELQMVINSMLDSIGLINWKVQISTEKENKSGTIKPGLNVLILSPKNKKAVRWKSWSGGEGQRLRLISALALSEVLLNRAGVTTNMEILDEPTQWLSAEGIQDLCEFLAARAQQLQRTTWYCEHQSVESTVFTSTLTLTKTKDGTRIGNPARA